MASITKHYIICFIFLQRYFSGDSKIPVLIVGNKADMTAVRQDYILQPEAFCAKHRVCKLFGLIEKIFLIFLDGMYHVGRVHVQLIHFLIRSWWDTHRETVLYSR